MVEENSQLNIDKQQLQEIQNQIKTLDADLEILNKEKESIVSAIEKRTKRGIKIWLYRWIGGGVLSLILMACGIYSGVVENSKQFLTNSIKDKFSEPRIHQTLTDVAKNEARSLIEVRLKPEIQNAKQDISDKTKAFDRELQTLKENYDDKIRNIISDLEESKNQVNQYKGELFSLRNEFVQIKMLLVEMYYLEYAGRKFFPNPYNERIIAKLNDFLVIAVPDVNERAVFVQELEEYTKNKRKLK